MEHKSLTLWDTTDAHEALTLRAMEPGDLDAMYRWENDTSLWHLGDTATPFSRATLRRFIDSATDDIHTTRQLRLIIDLPGVGAIGTADLFDFEPLNSRAAVGILIYDQQHRGKGFATSALGQLCGYAFEILRVRLLYVHIPVSNKASVAMCAKVGFTSSGVLRQWIGRGVGMREDVVVMQLLKDEYKRC